MLLRTRTETASDRLRAQTASAIKTTMLEVAWNTPLLLDVVANGPQTWRNRFLQTHRGLIVDDQIADMLFAFFCQQVQRQFGHQAKAGELLDALEVHVDRPPTQREIDESWEVESFSSEAGRRYFYGPDGHPEEIIKHLVTP